MENYKKTYYLTSLLILMILIVTLDSVNARPSSGFLSRRKRVSDQRLAELETLLALAKMRGKLVTVPLGFDRVDPAKIGRRRRSSTEYDLQKLQRFLQAAVRDSEYASEENDEIITPSWLEDRHTDDIEDQLI
ncbi:uncharacterized protein [Chelonus insularis]|uniref:uncharacterized protein n=1 Tax=Chelonus insularis TaxID=460826 RepID=UPI00158E615D|nr:uncharacterized protein LOC118071164 [Chelonus insularis]